MTEIKLQKTEQVSHIRKQISVYHVQQCFHWDCGLACVSMVLKYFEIPTDEVYTTDLDNLQCGENVWSIDLAYLLKRHNVPHVYYTLTMGVNKNYSRQPYYSRNYDKESVRINKAFTEAAANGIQVEKRSLTIDEIVDHLRADNIAICLVDWTAMECIWCDNLKKSCMCCLDLCASYEGHYIVLCGYDVEKRLIFYKNPSFGDEDLCCSRFSQFDKARKSFGTDEDVLLVFKDNFREETVAKDSP